MADEINNTNKIISELQLEALRNEEYLIVKEQDVRDAVEFSNWRYDVMREAIGILDKSDRNHPKERGLGRLEAIIKKIDGIYDE